MSVLWFAFGIYIIGVAVVLYLRPKLMFGNGGTWKEFGISNHNNYTVCPFWLFTLVWAVLSYVFATVGTIALSGLTIQSMTPQSDNEFLTPISSVPALPNNVSQNISPNRSIIPSPKANVSTELPGYYILQSIPGSQPKYVYFGTTPPTIHKR